MGFLNLLPSKVAMVYTMTTLLSHTFGAVLGARDDAGRMLDLTPADPATSTNNSSNATKSPGPFPVCTEANGPFAPFCLPHNGQDMVVDATYYVTWNADYYDLNATTTIELRYPNSSQGDSAYTSEKTENSYGYITLHMEKEWLQGKPSHELTLYIVEVGPSSNQTASVQQGPPIALHKRPPEHYKPPPRLPPSKLALYVGVPVSMAVVLGIVGGLYFGMRDSRRIGLGNIMGSCRKGYGIGKSKSQRVNSSATTALSDPEEMMALRRYTDDYESKETKDAGRSSSDVFTNDLTKLKSWAS